MSFPKKVYQKGSFGQIRKKPLFRFCRPILDVFGLTLLKSTASCHVYCELRFDILFENANCSPSGCFITIQLSFLSNFRTSERKRKKRSCPYSSSKKPKRLPLLAFEIITALNFSNLLREHSVPSLLGIFHFKKYFNKFLSSSILYLQILWEVLFWTSICRTYFGHCDETKVK